MSAFLYLPALPSVQASFGVAVHVVQTTVSASLIAFACGILISGPLSDRFGRRPMLIAGMLVFTLGSTLCLFAQSLPLLVAGRVIQALGTSTGVVVARALVTDVFPPQKVFRMIATLTMIMVLANGLSPFLGGLLVRAGGWRNIFVLLTAAGVLMVALAWRFIPETRTHRPGGPRLLPATIDLARRPAFLAYLVEGGVIIAIFQVFVATTPYLMQSAFHRSPEEFGLFTMFVTGGYFVGNLLVTRLGSIWGQQAMLRTGLAMQLGLALVVLALALLKVPGPYALYLPMCLLAIGQGLALPQINSFALMLAPQSAGLASSLIGFGQNVVSGASVQFVSLFPTGAGLPMIVFMVCAAAFAFACLWLVPQENA
jgi:DHA1 family bicyclomycin/chloramphenicol resistance-like MFS transporter